MKKVSVCLILNDDYWGTLHSFERSGFAIVEKKGDWIVKDAPKEYIKVIDNVEVELLVGYTKASDKALIDYFKPIATSVTELKNKDVIDGISDAQAYNQLFRLAQNEYVCILKPYVFLQQHWLTELIHCYQSIEKSGVIGICENFTDVDFAPLPSKELEAFVNVFLPKDNTINPNGVIFFLREYLYLVGALDESVQFVGGMEITQLQKRFIVIGYSNYYIPTQSCITVNKHSQSDYNGHQASNENLTKTLLEMKKAKNYYIPL